MSLSPKAGGNGTMGLALVKLNITEPTNKIVLNAKGIEFTKNLEKIQLSREAPKRAKVTRIRKQFALDSLISEIHRRCYKFNIRRRIRNESR